MMQTASFAICMLPQTTFASTVTRGLLIGADHWGRPGHRGRQVGRAGRPGEPWSWS